MDKIQINKTNITIRPSSIDTFLNCSYQWAKVFLEGKTSIPGARAAIGTGVHKGVELLWQEAIDKNLDKPNINMSAINDAAVEAFKKEDQDNDLQYDDGEDANTAINTILNGVEAFVDDIVPYTEVPKAVEKRYTIPISGNPIIAKISGTVDYITNGTLADVKTSKRKGNPAQYETQQGTYKLLAEANGEVINNTLIQKVVFGSKSTIGEILSLDVNTDKAKFIINTMLDTTKAMIEGNVAPEVLFRGNPKYYLCSNKYCKFHSTCPYVNGLIEPKVKQQPKL